jgi:hypothetical protein
MTDLQKNTALLMISCVLIGMILGFCWGFVA